MVIPPSFGYTRYELVDMAKAAKLGGGKLIVQGSSRYTRYELVDIAQSAPGQVIFEE